MNNLVTFNDIMLCEKESNYAFIVQASDSMGNIRNIRKGKTSGRLTMVTSRGILLDLGNLYIKNPADLEKVKNATSAKELTTLLKSLTNLTNIKIVQDGTSEPSANASAETFTAYFTDGNRNKKVVKLNTQTGKLSAVNANNIRISVNDILDKDTVSAAKSAKNQKDFIKILNKGSYYTFSDK